MPKRAWSHALPFSIALRLGSSFLLTNMDWINGPTSTSLTYIHHSE